MDKEKKEEFSFISELGQMDLVPKNDPVDEKKRLDHQDKLVRDYLMETKGIEVINDEDIIDFDS